MPFYTTFCTHCDSFGSVYRKIADRDVLPACERCEGPLTRCLDAPSVVGKVALFQEYRSPATDKVISSEKARRDDLRRSGCIPWEPGIKDQIAKRAEERNKASDNLIAARVDQTMTELSARGRL